MVVPATYKVGHKKAVVPDISKHYVVWDCDLIPFRRWSLFTTLQSGEVVPTVAILQNHGKPGAFELYCDTLRESLNIEPLIPIGGARSLHIIWFLIARLLIDF